jgi:hypothetical protein
MGSNPSQLENFIPLDQAVAMTTLFRNNREQILQPQYQGQDLLAICETFNRDLFDTLLAIPACAGIRIYYGMNADLTVHAVIIAVDDNGDDILPDSNEKANDGGGGSIGEEGQRCPPYCPDGSPLNGG